MALSRVWLYPNGGIINFSGSPSSETEIQIVSRPFLAPNPNKEFTGYTSGYPLVEHTDVTFTRDGYSFLEWNSSADGTGTSFAIGDTFTVAQIYAIWEEAAVVPNVTISYNGDTIASLSDSGTEVLETNGKLCEDDITIDYTKPTPNLQSKTASPTTSSQTVSPDNGYDGLSSVTINAMPSGSATTPATTITANPTISVSSGGLITASVSGSQSVTPTVSAGYVSSGTAGTVAVSGSNTEQLVVQAAQTITPTTTDQAIASGKYLTGTQTIKGDANLVAGNIKSGVSIFGVSGTYSAVNDLPSFIENGINIFSNSAISKIRSYAFMETSIFRIDCPSVTEIGNSAFYYCSRLVAISFPACISIASSVFNQCSSLATAIFPECTSVGSLAFFSCKKLSQISFPKLTTVSQSCFGNCPSLTTAIFPECLTVGNSAFVSCVALSQIGFPKCKSIFANAFAKCYSITSANFPECITLSGGNNFQDDYNLVDVSFPKLKSIAAFYTFDKCSNVSVLSFPVLSRTIQRGTFTNCYRLLSLYLMSTSVVYMADSSAFTSSPIGGYTNYTNGVYGSIYVPSSLLSSYKTATNWTYFSSRIVGI